MNSLIISQILNEYNNSPYYLFNDFISINDDRMSRIVSFKIYEKDNKILVDFRETYRYYNPYVYYNSKTKTIDSLEDFKKKWTNYYNNLN